MMTKRINRVVILLALMIVAAVSNLQSQGLIVPLDHCRIVDTAYAQPTPYHLYVGTEYIFNATLSDFSPQGGEARSCGIPVGASAVFLTVHIRDPYGPGYWRLWPTGGTKPYAASGTYGKVYDEYATWYVVGMGRSSLVKLDSLGRFSMEVAIYSVTRAIIDVQGYVTTAP